MNKCIDCEEYGKYCFPDQPGYNTYSDKKRKECKETEEDEDAE